MRYVRKEKRFSQIVVVAWKEKEARESRYVAQGHGLLEVYLKAQLTVDAGPAVMRARSFSRTGAKN